MTKNRDDNWIAYVGPVRQSRHEPGAARMLGIAKALGESGLEVRVGFADGDEVACTTTWRSSSGTSVRSAGTGELSESGGSWLRRAYHQLWSLGTRTVEWLEAQDRNPAAVIMYGGHTPYVARINLWCRANRVPLIADVVEWHDGRHMKGGRFGPLNVSNQLALRFLYHRSSGVIVISKFLEQYYLARNANVLRIPPLVDLNELRCNLQTESTANMLRLVYAGTPGKKDLLNECIDALMELNEKTTQVTLECAGVAERDLLALQACRRRNLQMLPTFITALGRVSRNAAQNLVSRADFSVVFRDDERVSRAGFPSKVPESLALGTPVMCNLTSDLDEYLEDGREALVSESARSADIKQTLLKACALTAPQRHRMRCNARYRAECAFAYQKYAQPLHQFVTRFSAAN